MSDDKTSGLALLRKPFPPNQINYLPKGGATLAYVGHAALTDRLLDADSDWNWEPLALTEQGLPLMDDLGGLWIRLTVCGVTRLGYGHAGIKTGGDAIKEVIGDALRNSAMRYGAALEHWHKGELHVDEPTPMAQSDIDRWTSEINAAGTMGEMKRVLAAAINAARALRDDDAARQFGTAAQAKVDAARIPKPDTGGHGSP